MANIPISAFTAAADTTGIGMSGFSLTGSNAQSMLDLSGTWNTSGTPTGIKLNVTDTASNAASRLMDLQVGGSSLFSVNKNGDVTIRSLSSSVQPYLYLENSNNTSLASLFYNSGIVAMNSDNRGFVIQTSAANEGFIGFGVNPAAAAARLYIDRAADTLAQRNGVNAQAFNIYNTYTDASNYERGFVRWAGNRLAVGTEGLGTGAQRDLDLQGTSVTVRIGTTNRWYFYTNNHFGPAGNATQDFGTVTLRIRDFYQGGFHEMAEQTAPTAPAADRVRIYAEDNGSGKTRLMALFATGAAQQIAIEP